MLCAGAAIGFADDIIVMRNGDVVNAKVLEISTSEIKYKKASRPDGPLYTVEKADVLAINYEDGEKETFDDAVKATNTSASTTQAEPTTPVINPLFSTDVNATALGAYSHDIHFTDKPKDKDARTCFGMFDFVDGSVINDGVMAVEYVCGHYDRRGETWETTQIDGSESGSGSMSRVLKNAGKANVGCFKGGIQVKLTNNSDQSLYVDLANTFFKRGSLASPYYVPTSTTSSSSSTTGASVNMGAVAGALGVGGSVGTLASGVNVGGSSSHGTTTTVYSQRVITLPPHSSIMLDPVMFMPSDMTNSLYGFKTKWYSDFGWGWGIDNDALGLKIGEERDYTQANSPMKWGFYLTYAADENFTSRYKMQSDMYLTRLIGYDSTKPSWDGNVWGKYSRLSPEFPQALHVFLFAH